MTEFDPTDEEPTDPDRGTDARDARALTEYLTVLPETGRARGAEDLFLVVSQSGSEYLVDAREGRCTCPDHEYRGVRCKHLRRVAYATGETPLPADVDDVDPQLGVHVDGGPCVAATDGGSEILEAPDGGEVLDESDAGDARPAECHCSGGTYETIACFPCWRAGYEDPNPEADTEGGA